MFLTNSNGKSVYRPGAIAALCAVGVGIIEIIITFLPGGNIPHKTVLDWLAFYQQNGFMGLRDMGLLNIFFNMLGILIFFTLYTAHRDTPEQPFAALVMALAFLGVGVFLATNRAFQLLAVSQQYAAATTAAQRATLEGAAQSLLSVGQSHSPGTFLGFFMIELAGVLISIIMLRGKIFSKATAYTGIIGYSMLLVFEFFASFFAGVSAPAMALAMVGGIASMAWNILVARRLFKLAA